MRRVNGSRSRDNDDPIIVSENPEEQTLVAQLASLLDVGFALAQRALQHCQWNFEAAVNAACELAASEAGPSNSAALSSPTPGNVLAPVQGGPSHSAASSSSAPNSSPAILRGSSSSSGNRLSSSSSQVLASTSSPSSSTTIARSSSSLSNSGLASTNSEPSSTAVATPAGYKRMHSSLAHDAPDVFVPADGPDPGAKKRRFATPSMTFTIPNNNADPPADNLPMFQVHPLREEQRRSLGWMISQEKKQRLRGGLRGGVLADRMGYGKTSTAIGLISLDVDKPLREPGQRGVPLYKSTGSHLGIPSDSTLIVCPAHLVDQWEGEFCKFLGHDEVQIMRPQDRDWVSKNTSKLTRTFKVEGEPQNLQDFGINVVKAPSSWSKVANTALITNIKPQRPGAFATTLTSSDTGLQRGDMICKVECKHLKKVFLEHPSENCTVASLSKSGFRNVSCFLKENQHKNTETVRTGSYTDGNGNTVPTFSWREAKLVYTTKSTVTFTILRMNEEMPRTQAVKGRGRLKVLTIKSCDELGMLQQQDLISKVHVVLVSAGIHSEHKYAEAVRAALGRDCGSRMGDMLAWLPKKVAGWCTSRSTFEESVLSRNPPIFEVIFWHRVILDEFHESEAWEYRVREMLRSLGTMHKWGLSGTPPLSSPAAVAEVAGVLGYSSPSKDGDVFAQSLYYGSSVRSYHNSAQEFFASEKNQAALKELAENFVKIYVRQNTSDLVEQIAVVEHHEHVEHTSEERLIYRQACHDQHIFDLTDGYNNLSLSARAELLKRCAHFDMVGDAESAISAVSNLGNRKREWVTKVESQLWLEVARARLFRQWESAGKEAMRSVSVVHSDAKALVQRILESSVEELESQLHSIDSLATQPAFLHPQPEPAFLSPESRKLQQALRVTVTLLAKDGTDRLRPEVRLVQPIQADEYYKNHHHRHAVVHAVARRAENDEADGILCGMAVCEHACNGNLFRAFSSGFSELVAILDKAHRSLQFYTQQLDNLAQQDASSENECSICLESTCDIHNMAILPCSHVFHSECIRAVLAKSPHCPECRVPVNQSHVSSVVMELKPAEPRVDEPSLPARSMSKAWKEHGSKLNAVASRLREIRRQDSTAKALVFVQWADLETKVCGALKDHNLPFLHLSKNPIARSRRGQDDGAVLRSFQEDDTPDAPFVLVLSLQRAAAGTNLTKANHVLFVHPMNAETVQIAAAYERQALARVRRIGQTRNEVHVWRFVTKQTVEEHIWKLHSEVPENVAADQALVASAREAAVDANADQALAASAGSAGASSSASLMS